MSLKVLFYVALLSLLPFNPWNAAAAPANGPATASVTDTIPDAPSPQPETGQIRGATFPERVLNELDPGYNGTANKWDITVNIGEKVLPYTPQDKIHYALLEQTDPIVLFTAAWSAGYEQLRNSDPKYGSDEGAFAQRFGAAMFRQGVNRMLGDGVFPALTHEDPRYYRIGRGKLWYRTLNSAKQTFIRNRDDGTLGVNYSGLLGHAIADSVPLSFYPERSQHASVALTGFATSLAADASLKLFREFIPDIFQGLGLIPRNAPITPTPNQP